LPGTNDSRFAIWDYKTGTAWRFRNARKRSRAASRETPFDQGRLIQGTLYMALAEARLKDKVSPGARVALFGYFFPSLREHGERIQWSSTELAEGTQVLLRVCEMIEKGCFPFTDDPDDVRSSDYLDAFGDVETASERIRRKLENSMNGPLAPFQELRGYGRKNEE
jgi:hypothetical protein